MEQVKDFRVDTVEVSEAKLYSLPSHVLDLFRIYATPLEPTRAGVLRFELPVYRWKEISKFL